MEKKVFVIVSIFIFAFGNSFAQQLFVSDTTAKRLKVKTAIEKVFFGESKSPSMTYTEFYDTSGRGTKQISLNNHFNEIQIVKYWFYNEKGQLIQEKSVHYQGKDSILGDQSFTYNTKGGRDSTGLGKISYKYDSKGRVKERIEKTAKPYYKKIIYNYNSYGQIESEKFYLENVLQTLKSSIYDDKGRVSAETWVSYDKKGQTIISQDKTTYTHDESGLILTEVQNQIIVDSRYDSKPDNRVYTYEYTFY